MSDIESKKRNRVWGWFLQLTCDHVYQTGKVQVLRKYTKNLWAVPLPGVYEERALHKTCIKCGHPEMTVAEIRVDCMPRLPYIGSDQEDLSP